MCFSLLLVQLRTKRNNKNVIITIYNIVDDYDVCYLYIMIIIIIIVIIIMGIFKCYYSGEHIDLSLIKNNNNDVNMELGKTNRLKALCMVQVNT